MAVRLAQRRHATCAGGASGQAGAAGSAGGSACGGTGCGPETCDQQGCGGLECNTETKSQWFNACTSGARGHVYPYGDSYEAKACNGWEHGLNATVPSGSIPSCQSPEPGYGTVYDPSGNAREWEDCCDEMTGAADLCLLRGGAWGSGDAYLRCNGINEDDRQTTQGDVGFRCCADLP